MINAKIVRDLSGRIIGFTVKNHGESITCAAVSMLVLNTVNSIETFLPDEGIIYEYNETDGYLTFSLIDPASRSDGMGLLLDTMFLGLVGTKNEYPDEIELEQVFELPSEVTRKETLA